MRNIVNLICLSFLICIISCDDSGFVKIDATKALPLQYIVKSDEDILSAASSFGYSVKNKISYDGSSYFLLETSQSLNKVESNLRSLCEIDWIELEQKRLLSDSDSEFQFPIYFNSYQAMYDISSLQKAVSNFGFGTNVAEALIIDTGLNLNHIEFNDPNFFVGYSGYYRKADGTTTAIVETKAVTINGVDYSNVPIFQQMVSGINYDGNQNEGHGSHVAGIVAGSKKILGVCGKNCKVFGYKTFAYNKQGLSVSASGSDYGIYGAILHYLANKENDKTAVINMSFGSLSPSRFEAEVMLAAVKNNLLPIAAAGNKSKIECEFPATLNCVMCVTAANWDGSVAGFSSQNPTASVSAVGKNVFSVKGGSDDGYCYMEGTSMATPYVTGLAAYLLTLAPSLSVGELRTIVEDGATDKGDVGQDPQYGYGLVDVYNSAAMAIEHQKYIDTSGVEGTLVTSRYYEATVSVYVYKEINQSNSPQRVAQTGTVAYLYKTDSPTAGSFNFYSVGVVQKDGLCTFAMLEEGSYRLAVGNNYLEFDLDFTNPLVDLELKIEP